MNLLDEARSIRSRFPPGTSISAISREMQRSFPWVKYRLDILKLPPSLQEAIAAGLLTFNDIRVLMSLPPEKRHAAAETMSRHGRGSFAKPRRQRFKRKRRSQINRMIERLFELGLDGLSTKLLAWTQGGVSDDAIELEILRFSQNHLANFDVVPLYELNPASTDRPISGGECHLPEGRNGSDGADDAGNISPAGD